MASGVLIVSGPTASGKSDLAVALATEFDAEIVGADSRQIYRDMPIGTALPSPAQREAVPHHLIDFLAPHERYSAAQFVVDAIAAIDDIHARGKRAIVAGGTGFYIRALCGDVHLAPQRDSAIRSRLAREAQLHPPHALFAWLQAIAPERAAALHEGDAYRTLRALEISLAAREPAAQTARTLATLRARAIAYRKIYLEIDRAVLAERIVRRTEQMLSRGLLEEAWRLGGSVVAADALGYPQALAYLRGWATKDELLHLLARATRRYAKRQETWFRTEPDLQRVRCEQAHATVAKLARELPGWN